MDGLLFNVCDILVNNILTDVLYFSFVYKLLKVAAFYVCEDIELLDLAENLFSGFKSNLTAVASVNLIAIVLCRVVACGNNDTCVTAERSYSPRKHRCGHKLCVDVCCNAVCGKDRSGVLCEYIRLYSAVVCNSNLKIALACVLEVVCKTLSSLTYGINVHSVCTCADNASQTARAEFKITVETVVYFFVLALYALKLCL